MASTSDRRKSVAGGGGGGGGGGGRRRESSSRWKSRPKCTGRVRGPQAAAFVSVSLALIMRVPDVVVVVVGAAVTIVVPLVL